MGPGGTARLHKVRMSIFFQRMDPQSSFRAHKIHWGHTPWLGMDQVGNRHCMDQIHTPLRCMDRVGKILPRKLRIHRLSLHRDLADIGHQCILQRCKLSPSMDLVGTLHLHKLQISK